VRPVELFDALAGEVEALEARFARQLEILATLDAESEEFTESLVVLSEDTQRLGEACEAAGLPGLQAVCEHVLQNVLVLPGASTEERVRLVEFLGAWTSPVVFYLRNTAEPSAAAGLIDRLVTAPVRLEETSAHKLMYL
jgi:hypothetical protein